MIVVEFAHSAHVDSLITLISLAAIYWLTTDRLTKSVFALALATLTKYVPALLLPLFVRRWGIWRTTLFGFLLIISFLPFLNAGLGLNDEAVGTGIFGTLRIYSTRWKTNDGLFFWLAQNLESRGITDPIPMARIIAICIVGATGLAVLYRSPRRDIMIAPQTEFSHAALLVTTYLLLTPAMFPWYLTWLIALLSVLSWHKSLPVLLFSLGWLYFSAAVNLSYLFYLDPANPGEQEWIRRREYLPLLTTLSTAAVAFFFAKRRRIIRSN